jgi:hypothetical protein
MLDVTHELKALRLHGMAAGWSDLAEQDQTALEGARWLLEHLLRAEAVERTTC